MAGKKHPAARTPKPRENTPLLFLLLLLFPLYGGYYNFITLLAGAVLVPLLIHTSLRAGYVLLPRDRTLVPLAGLCLGNLLVLPFAVSWGMAFTGFLRVLVWLLFFLYAATYSQAERQSILDAAAYEGAILSLLAMAVFLYNSFSGVEDANGRMDGPFQYANTWALYLMLCLILLLLREGKRRPLDWAAMACLLSGIYLSGSRGIFLLLLALAAAYGVWYLANIRKPLPLLLAAGGGAALFGLSVVLSGGLTLDRLRAITLSSSSLNGRLLYYLDGLRILLAHPMGVGRGGYLYVQPLWQSGVYTLRYIHNEYLQAALDGGLLAGVCALALPLCLLGKKGLPFRERAVIFAAAAHALIDFDAQFTGVVLLVLLCGAGGETRTLPLPSRRAAVLAGGGVLTLALSFFSLVYALDFFGRPELACTLFPADLSLMENGMQRCSSAAQAEPMADRVLASTDLSMVALDCKFALYLHRGDGPSMAQTKLQYLRLSPYRAQVHEDFAVLMTQLCAQCSPEELPIYQDLAREGAEILEEVKQRTSPLAWRISDKPEPERSQTAIAQLRSLLQ